MLKENLNEQQRNQGAKRDATAAEKGAFTCSIWKPMNDFPDSASREHWPGKMLPARLKQ